MKHKKVNNTRLRISVAVFVLAVFAVANVLSARVEAAVTAYRPSDPSHIVLRLTDKGSEKAIENLRFESLAAPNDIYALERYVEALLAIGATTGNERYYGFAEQAVNNAPTIVRERVKMLHAQLLQHRHDFRSAEAVLSQIVTADARNFEAVLVRAQVRIHLHEPEKAADDCARLMLKVDLLTSTTCIAQARAAMSSNPADLERVYSLVTAMLKTSSDSSPSRSWSLGLAAELAMRLLKDDEAERWYRSAYASDPANHYIRITYADWLLTRGRAVEAYEVVRGSASNADILRAVLAKNTSNSREARQLQLSWREAASRGERTHLRDQARFEFVVLKDPARAHLTALDNFQDQREIEDALLLAQTATTQKDLKAIALLKSWQSERRFADRRLDNLLAGLQ